ncbi:alpha/beta fold hydrolase [Streptomyces resistomycificus]|uniref:Carboxylesterase n=1 Tax=Streptomyces resistomycificus TaxID=67356 RepID=A0A0L8LG35_9ACTN|nr:alpha/beta hydrolase [Streptomyces resistomycificus]KOG37080.1 carboxylesterase [Streptomyces resistomycificus]KUN95027.1 carboxylesterase [Streptomyces resistomycificus]
MAEDLTDFLAAYDAVLDQWPVPVDRMDLTSEYGTTRVTACGPAGGEPLVLLHGGGATSAVWFANVGDLSRTRRVYAVDRIGEAGRSRPGDRPVRSVDDLLDWLDGVLDGLGLRSTDLCGHSYGAWIALTCALRTPNRVRKLALLDPTQCFAGFRATYLLRALPTLIRPTARRARAFIAWETDGADVDPAWLELYARAAEFPHTKVVVGRRPRPRRLRGSTVPTLVLLAGDSRAHDVRRVEAAARRDLPDAETAVLPGISHHSIPFTRAAELDGVLLDFLAKP